MMTYRRPHFTKNHQLEVAALLIVLALTPGCGPGNSDGPPPPLVTVTQPLRRDITPYGEFTGTSRAIEYAEVRARVSGVLERVAFQPSTMVTAGQLLFVIERGPYQASRDAAFADLKSARAEAARAASDLDRIELAIESNAVSEQDLDRARAQRDQADAAVLAAQAALDRAELDLSYTMVRSPFGGQVSRNLVDVGNIVGFSELTLLTTVNKLDPMYVYFDAPESLVLQLLAARRDTTRGDIEDEGAPKAYVGLANEQGYPHEGILDYIDNTVNPTTGTIQLRAELPNGNGVLFPGLFVRIRIPSRVIKGALLVDERAIGTDLGGKYVYLVGEDNIVEQRYVQLGPVQDDGMVVVEMGLDGDEGYIINGLLQARPGLPVTPQLQDEVGKE